MESRVNSTVGLLANVVLLVATTYETIHYLPAYEMIINEANQAPGTRVHLDMAPVAHPEMISCPESNANIVDLLSVYYYTKNLSRNITISMSPLCATAILEVSPLLREWNIPFFTVSGNAREMRDQTKYPTLMSTSVSENSFLQRFVKKVLLDFKWTTVFFLCDDGTTNFFYNNNCKGLRPQLHSDPRFLVRAITVNTRPPNVLNYDLVLSLIAKQARVVLLMLDMYFARQFLVHAYHRDMTGSNYVYIYAQPFFLPIYYPHLTWKWNDADDLAIRHALASVLYIISDAEILSSKLPNSTRNILLQLINANRPAEKVETDIPAELIAALQTVDVIVQTANDLMRTNLRVGIEQLLAGRRFKSSIAERTFVQATGNITFDQDGFKIPNYLLKQFNSTTGEYENVLFYDGRQQSSFLAFDRNFTWTTGKVPENEPRCGFDGTDPSCLQGLGRDVFLMAGILGGIFLFGVILAIAVFRHLAAKYSVHQMTFIETDNLSIHSSNPKSIDLRTNVKSRFL